MITLQELSELKELRKTTLYYEEKEYLHYIFLNAISNYTEKYTFKGGTCLRICYGLERASEDLDFCTQLSTKDIRETVKKCLNNFALLSINHKTYEEKEYRGNIRFEIRFEGPLYTGKPSSTNMLKIDFNQQKIKHKVAKVVPKLFSDVPLFTLLVLDEKEILAEKIRALANRKQARDLYDVWMLLHKGIAIEKKLLLDKLKEEKSSLQDIVLVSREEYERDLRNLVITVPPYEQVKKDVTAFLKNII